MRQVELSPGIISSALGFGCAPILGSVDASKAARAIDVAIDLGVNHFDLARSYGYGEAESFVGRHLQAKRDSIRIATKFGIEANWKASLLRPLKPLVRRLRKPKAARDPGETQVNVVADRFHDRVPITAEAMKRSLEISLRALRTDYVDYLFVHEPLQSIADWEATSTAARKLKQEGKIRCFGLATPSILDQIHEAYLDEFDLLQFASPVTKLDYTRVVSSRGSRPTIIFSPMRSFADEKPSESLHRLQSDFVRSVILCSMFNPNHIRENASSFCDETRKPVD